MATNALRSTQRPNVVGPIARGVLILLVACLVGALLSIRFQVRQSLALVRQFNKLVTNPMAMRFAGRSGASVAVVQHTGRRSGRTYSTPVTPASIPGGFIIPLPYGADVDWVRNVRAAGHFTLRANGVDYLVDELELIDDTSALPLVAPSLMPPIRVLGIKHALKVKELSRIQSPTNPAANAAEA